MTKRALIGIDGNCGFALLGEDLQEGEAEFELIATSEPEWTTAWHIAACRAATVAYRRLKARLELEHLSYELDASHPNYC